MTFLHITNMVDRSRRDWLKGLALGATAVLGAAALPPRRSPAADAVKLDVHDPAAMSLGYVENASRVDRKKYPQFVAGSNCENCLQLQGKPGNNYRPCSLFQGKLVSVSGWCSGWAAEI
jgi:High potential iron-sulfur protein